MNFNHELQVKLKQDGTITLRHFVRTKITSYEIVTSEEVTADADEQALRELLNRIVEKHKASMEKEATEATMRHIGTTSSRGPKLKFEGSIKSEGQVN